MYFLASGVKHELDFFESYMQTHPFKMPYYDKKTGKKKGDKWVFGILAPIKLYKFVFPKEYLNEMVKTMGFDKEAYPMFDVQRDFLRKIMKAKKLPKIPKDTKPRLFPSLNLALKPIGYKEDLDIFEKGFKHEGL